METKSTSEQTFEEISLRLNEFLESVAPVIDVKMSKAAKARPAKEGAHGLEVMIVKSAGKPPQLIWVPRRLPLPPGTKRGRIGSAVEDNALELELQRAYPDFANRSLQNMESSWKKVTASLNRMEKKLSAIK